MADWAWLDWAWLDWAWRIGHGPIPTEENMNKGFSLLEVMIALTIVSISLLGFAESELVALKTEKNFQQDLII
jgi:prepilin-type N-terminal cleavage/methylation domain-containing protein